MLRLPRATGFCSSLLFFPFPNDHRTRLAPLIAAKQRFLAYQTATAFLSLRDIRSMPSVRASRVPAANEYPNCDRGTRAQFASFLALAEWRMSATTIGPLIGPHSGQKPPFAFELEISRWRTLAWQRALCHSNGRRRQWLVPHRVRTERIVMSPGANGSLWAKYSRQPAVLVKAAGTGYRGDRI